MASRFGFGFLVFTTLLLSACGGPKYPKCEDTEDCRDGEFCVSGMCQQCRQDDDCAEGAKCEAGRCVAPTPECRSDAECSGGKCVSGACVLATEPPPQPASTANKCSLSPIFFDFDVDGLTHSARDQIEANANCMKTMSINEVRLIGHTDPRGTEEYNLALGDRRARAVKKYLGSLGVEANVRVSSMGEEDSRGSDETSWKKDRRVVLKGE